jgi:hypothetical protein
MLRRLLNIAAIICLVLCVALMGMWVFSSVCDEAVHGSLTDAVGDFQIASIQGRLSILREASRIAFIVVIDSSL